MSPADVEREHLEQHDRTREYDDNDRCTGCGEHIADPHAPNCPRVAEAEVEQIDRIIDTSLRVEPSAPTAKDDFESLIPSHRDEEIRKVIVKAHEMYDDDEEVRVWPDAAVDDADEGFWVTAQVWVDNTDLES